MLATRFCRVNTRPRRGAAVFEESIMNLNSRRKIEVELPEFLLRSLLFRVAENNAAAAPDEEVELNGERSAGARIRGSRLLGCYERVAGQVNLRYAAGV